MPTPRRRLRTTSTQDALRAGFAAIRTELAVPVDFTSATLAEADAAAAMAWATGAATANRVDLTAVPFVTLDPVGSTDLDQAMHLSRAGAGYVVRYAIADTAVFVRPGGSIDRSAHARVETIYCPDLRVPLHPRSVSEGAASLLPGVVRPAVVWTMSLGADGEVGDVAVERAVVRSTAQLDYPSQQARLDAGADHDDVVTLLAEIGTLRARLEQERGGVSLARPEQEVVELDGGGWGLAFRAPLAVEDHNAQVSLMTGMAAAQLMLAAGVGVLRTMPVADARDLARLRRQAAALHVPWPEGATYGDVLRAVDHARPETAAFLAAATTLFRGAAWTPFDGAPPAQTVHGALAAPYAHVTAPLRRLVDRYGLEICLASHAGTEVPAWVRDALPTIGDVMEGGARRAAAVDRACTDLVEATVLAPYVGRVFDGVVLDDRTVQLEDLAVVARLDRDGLPEGERVSVRLTQADPATRAVRFARHDPQDAAVGVQTRHAP